MTDQSETWVKIVYLLLGIVFISQIFIFRKGIQVDYKTFIIAYGYVFLSGISSIINSDIRLLQGSLLLFLLYYVSFVVLSSVSFVNVNKIIYKTILIIYTFIVLVPLLLNGVQSIPYQGIFYNPNSLGIISASLFAVVFSVFLYNVEAHIDKVSTNKKSLYIKLSINIIILFTLFYLVILSGSRTSFITCIVILLISSGHLLFYLIKEKKIVSFFVRGFLLLLPNTLVLGLIVKVTSITEFLNITIIDKFQRKSGSGDVLDNRGEVWIQTIKEAGLFGNGGDYFNTSFLIGSHNTFINVLGRYGWIPLIFYVILILILFYYSIRYTLTDVKDEYKYMPLATCIGFFTLSIAENVSFSLIMIVMFFSVSSIVFSAVMTPSVISKTSNS